MTRDQKLDAIVTRCRELLALAEKRTPGKWGHVVDSDRCGSVFGTGGIITDCGPNINNTFAFIASCAGNAEAGWKATIAAIEGLRATERVRKVMAQTGKDFYVSGAQRAFPLMCNAIDALDSIITAWEGQL